MDQFICESALPQSEIHAAAAAGELKPWRVDASGRQWFRRVRGVPAAFDVEFVDEHGNVLAEDPSAEIDAEDLDELAALEAELDERGYGFSAYPLDDGTAADPSVEDLDECDDSEFLD